MKFSSLTSILFVVILSMATSKIVYYGFTPSYAADIFSPATFNVRFSHDVYKYRILAKYMLFAVDRWIGDDVPENIVEARLQVDTPDASQRFYTAFYYLNTFFLILTSIVVIQLLALIRAFRFTDTERHLISFFIPILIGLTEFTVCCYDVSSYFYQMLILYLYLRFASTKFNLTIAAISALIVISTLNRESSALSVSLISTLLIARDGPKRRTWISIGVMAFSFLATYIALHVLIVDPIRLHVYNKESGNLLLDTNLMGLFFWAAFFYLTMAISSTIENRYMIGVFFLFCAPYIYTCLVDGVLWEVRLYVPLFLGGFFLSRLDTTGYVVRYSSLPQFLSKGIGLNRTAP